MPRKKKADAEPPKSRSTDKPKRRTAVKVSKVPRSVKVSKASPASSQVKAGKSRKTPSAPPAKQPVSAEIDSTWKKPKRQGETRMVAFVRDPYCLFTYWEVTPQSAAAVQKQLMDEYRGSSMVLRVFKVGADGREELIDEIEVGPDEMNRYVELRETGGSYFIEIAQKTVSGKTVPYARSNKIITSSTGAPAAQAQDTPSGDPPAGFLEYFAEMAESESFFPPKGISSAENQLRKRNRYFSSPFSS